MLGSQDFVHWLTATSLVQVKCVHVLEMVGYASEAPGSQRVPPGLPVQVSDQGNFLALLANHGSYGALDSVLAEMEDGMTLLGRTVDLPSGSRIIVVSAVMALVLIVRPGGLTGGRELSLPRLGPAVAK